MRKILFRGKRIDNGEWVDGNSFIPDFVTADTQICIGTPIIRITYNVIPETIGQYTGLTDKNGKKIFEGDIVKNEYQKGCFQYGFFRFNSRRCAFEVVNRYGCTSATENIMGDMEVIGNIHDNPELLGGTTNE